MTDRITQLERLNRLRAEGALSEQEFNREKGRLLEARPSSIWLFAIPALAAAAIAAALILVPRREPARQAPGGAQPMATAPVAASTPIPRPAAVPQPLDISSPIRIADGGCGFAPDLERAFGNMLHYEGTRVRPREVRFGTMRLTPSLTSSQEEGVNLPDFRQYESVVTFNRPVLWNGLRLTGLRAAMGLEWGSSTLDFEASPARVRAALQRIGIRIPASGSLELPAEGCPNSIAVTARGTGAALSCGGGC